MVYLNSIQVFSVLDKWNSIVLLVAHDSLLDLLRMEQVFLVSSAVYLDYLQVFFAC